MQKWVTTNILHGQKLLLQFCAIYDLDIAYTVFQTYQHLESDVDFTKWRNHQIDYILVQRKLKGQLKNSWVYISVELGSDHFLVIANIDVKPCALRSHREVLKRYDVDMLCDKERQGKSSR